MITLATAITRLTSGPVNLFGGLTSGQQLQRVNEVLERFYDEGTWRGLHDTIPLASSGGVITLTVAYQRLDGLAVPADNCIYDIRSDNWAFSKSGPGPQDWTKYGQSVALDQGDSAGGQRQYLITADAPTVDAKTFQGWARKRYTWATDTSTVLYPDCYQALALGVKWLFAEDEKQTKSAEEWHQMALRALNGNLDEFEIDYMQVNVQLGWAGSTVQPIH